MPSGKRKRTPLSPPLFRSSKLRCDQWVKRLRHWKKLVLVVLLDHEDALRRVEVLHAIPRERVPLQEW